jgi:hypothetical protein
MGLGAGGFWGYVHVDDDQDHGRIRRLATAVKNEYSLITGQDLELFVDHDIAWGEEWKARIDNALSATTFFIPIVTPRYFTSSECRRELLTFAGHARSLGRAELLMPIYYVTVPVLEGGEDPDDEAVALVKAMQWVDWRKLRLEAEDSPAYREEVHRLAGRLAEISASITVREEEARELPRAEAGDDDPGVVELVAEAEPAMLRFTEALEQLGPEMSAVGDIADAWSPRLERAAAKGAGPALLVFRGLANDLDAPAGRIHELGARWASELVTIDPAVLSLIRLAEAGYWSDAESREFFSAIHEMKHAADEALAELRGLVSVIDQTGELSRDLRRPRKRMKEGLRSILDGQAILDEWDRRARQVEDARDESDSAEDPPEPSSNG